ncbi:MAG: YicC/YloC family endoribonuclease [Pseudomonadota bacterium]
MTADGRDGDQALRSMTGYGRASGDAGGRRWTWELKSVNGRGLEMRFRLPPGLDQVEAQCRKLVAQRLTRGNLNCNLAVDASLAGAGFAINDANLDAAIAAIAAIRSRIETAPPRPEAILALRGVLDVSDKDADPDAQDAAGAALVAGFEAALGELISARVSEGAALKSVIGDRLTESKRLIDAAAAVAKGAGDAFRARLEQQLADLIDSEKVPADRLAQEAAMLAVRADVREELDRLEAHVAAARELIDKGGALGRRLDFLTQELNREANTLCAKAPTLDLKAIGLDLKTVIDQMREQAQNVE